MNDSVMSASSTHATGFLRDGYLVLRGVLDPATIEAVLAEVRQALDPLLGPVEYEADVGYPGAPADRAQVGGLTPRRLLAAYARGGTLRDEARAFESALAAGVNIAFGTDVGIFDHGQNAREFSIMVKLGMGPADAIHSATVQTARLFGLDEELGTLAPGKQADLIAVSGNPLTDVEALFAVEFVMRGGRVAKRNGRFVAVPDMRPVGAPVKLR